MVKAVEVIERDYPSAIFDGTVLLLNYEYHDAIWRHNYVVPHRVLKSQRYLDIYHNFKRPITLSVDDKTQNAVRVLEQEKLQNTPMPFPTTFLTCEEALTAETLTPETIYYVKDSRSTRAEGIKGIKRPELEAMQMTDRCRNEKRVFQETVTDSVTISDKRFDIRFYIMTYNGKVYLHQHAVMIYMDDAPGSFFDHWISALRRA
jgi:hypothetical protein